jgi:hypothetical protein
MVDESTRRPEYSIESDFSTNRGRWQRDATVIHAILLWNKKRFSPTVASRVRPTNRSRGNP